MDTPKKSSRTLFTISEAANHSGTSRSTVRRALDAGAFPNAVRSENATRTWRIPVEDLLAAGFEIRRGPSGEQPSETPMDEVAELRLELERARAAARMYEAIAAERVQALEDLRVALRMLPASVDTEVQGPSAGLPRRRRWWNR